MIKFAFRAASTSEHTEWCAADSEEVEHTQPIIILLPKPIFASMMWFITSTEVVLISKLNLNLRQLFFFSFGLI